MIKLNGIRSSYQHALPHRPGERRPVLRLVEAAREEDDGDLVARPGLLPPLEHLAQEVEGLGGVSEDHSF